MSKTHYALMVAALIFSYREAAGSPPSLTTARVTPVIQRLTQYEDDLLAVRQTRKGDSGSLGYEVASDLAAVAALATTRMEAVSVLLELYEGLSCSADQLWAATLIREDIAYHARQFALLEKSAHLGMVHADNPTIAGIASKLRAEFRDLATWLANTNIPRKKGTR